MEQISLIIITADTRLGQVLSDEAALLGVSSLICVDALGVSREEWEGAQLAVVDLEGKLAGTIPEHVRVLGLCRDPEALSPRARRLAHVLYRRPFRMADLRVEFASLGGVLQIQVPTPVQSQITSLTLVEESRCVLMGNRQISLTDKEFAVLSMLVQNGEKGISKQELSALLDAGETNEGQVYICHLRRKLEHAFGVRLIKTVRNKGYVYVGAYL
ncbi:MAG: winged helix-turn-helix transcriptional regulator [Clostridia bacterium]|nr:winged helix-turn-helix transcriptional regulator [Clostridia bacterium]